jgi:hypothetical protein
MQLDELGGTKVVVLKTPTLPPRSRLYSLAPIGIGTPEVESLTGYIGRLAKAHCVTISLLRKEFGDKLGNKSTFRRFFSSSNGVAPTAASRVRAVESLTHRGDLRNLTMLSWANVLPFNGLLRSSRAWCSDCLREQATVYEPLNWRIAVVEACPQHRRVLNSRCPLCSETLPLIDWHMWPGQCSKCGCCLGDDTVGSASNKAASSYQLWKANAVGEMLAISPDEPFSSGLFMKALRLWTQKATISETARRFDVPGCTVLTWLKGTSLPKLEKLLAICRKLETSPLPFLTLALPESGSKRIAAPRARSERPRTSNWSTKIDLAKIRVELEETLRNGASNPPSTAEVCRRIGHSPMTLYKYFPELCRAISKAHMEWCVERRVRREQALIEEVCRVATSLKEDGIEPSVRRVSYRMAKPGSILNPIARATLARIRLERN